MAKRVLVRVDRERCVGAAMCVAVAPETFMIDAQGKAVVIIHSADEAERVRQAAEECPAAAVILEDAETREQLFP